MAYFTCDSARIDASGYITVLGRVDGVHAAFTCLRKRAAYDGQACA